MEVTESKMFLFNRTNTQGGKYHAKESIYVEQRRGASGGK